MVYFLPYAFIIGHIFVFDCFLWIFVVWWSWPIWWSHPSIQRNRNHVSGNQHLQLLLGPKRRMPSIISGNKQLMVLFALEVVPTRTLTLVTMDVRNHRLIVVSRETMKEALKSLNIAAEELAGSILIMKLVKLQSIWAPTRPE